MKKYPLQLENYFFTHQEVIANPDFSQDASARSENKINFNVTKHAAGRYSIAGEIALDKDKSDNSPYYFHIAAFASISIDEEADIGQIDALIHTAGTQLLVGVMRERLAELTSRGPWRGLHLNFVPIVYQAETEKKPEKKEV